MGVVWSRFIVRLAKRKEKKWKWLEMERWEIMKYVKLPKRSIIISKGEGRSGLLGKGEQNSGRAPQEIFVKFLVKN